MVLTLATGPSHSAGSVTAVITALPEMAPLSLDHVRKDITVHMETPLQNPPHTLQEREDHVLLDTTVHRLLSILCPVHVEHFLTLLN